MSAWLAHMWLVVELLPSQTRHNLSLVNGWYCTHEDYPFAATAESLSSAQALDHAPTLGTRRSAAFGVPMLNKRGSSQGARGLRACAHAVLRR
jgi:hypothetical protein